MAGAERKAVIKNADMAEDMQQDAVECATQVSSFNNSSPLSSVQENVRILKHLPNLLNEVTNVLSINMM